MDNNFWCRLKKFLCYGFKGPKVITQDKEYLSNLRKLRTELQDLVSMTHRAKSGSLSMHNHKGYIDKTFEDISILIADIKRNEGESDSIRHILNIWEQMCNSKKILKKDSKDDHAGYLQFLTLLEEQAQEIVLYIGIKTIPPRINKWLKDTHSGAVLPFHLLFEDEFLRDADRHKVLEYISWKPKAISDRPEVRSNSNELPLSFILAFATREKTYSGRRCNVAQNFASSRSYSYWDHQEIVFDIYFS